MKKTLYSERLIVREFEQRDVEAFFELMKDEEVNTFLPWYPFTTIKEAQSKLDMYLQDENGYHYAICLKEENKVIGYVNVSGDDSHDFGYGLHKAYWHKGIVSEACTLVLEELKKNGVPYISATHDRKNPRSGEVMKHLGMKYEYSYEELWQPKNILVTFRMYQLNFQDDIPVYSKYWDTSSVHEKENI
ncbi:GNAT family N-acetyltransferase [Amedibacillus sp. YH-ame6]